MADKRFDIAGRWIYSLEVVLFGLPSLAISIPLLFLGLIFIVGSMESINSANFDDVLAYILLTLVLGAGFVGIAAWFVLSGHYLSGGRHALKKVDTGWWGALAVGMLLALAFVVCCVATEGWRQVGLTGWTWFAGPALVLPCLHLIWAKMSN